MAVPTEESWTTKRARVAAWHTNHPGEPVPEHLLADLRAARAEKWAREVAAAAPPLSAEMKVRIACIILGGGAA